MKPYGILRVCRAWRLSRATVQRHKAQMDAVPRISAKRGPKTLLSDEELLTEIRSVLASNLFVGEGHRKVWARLRHEHGVRTSMRRVLRIMREHGILAQDRPTGVRGPDTHDRTITTAKPDEMWAIDATGCLTYEGDAAVFVVVDHCTGECLGVRAALRGMRYEAIECLREAPPRPRQPVHLACLPGRAQDPRHRVEPVLRPPARRQRLRRAIHPHPEGAAALAAAIPHGRGARPGAPRLRTPLQQPLDHRADRLPNASNAPTHPPRGGRVNTDFNLSQKLDAVQRDFTPFRTLAQPPHL
jgi:hypothetical protein